MSEREKARCANRKLISPELDVTWEHRERLGSWNILG